MDPFDVLGIVAIAALAAGALIALFAGRLVLSGTLFVFTAFAIYLREIRDRSSSTGRR